MLVVDRLPAPVTTLPGELPPPGADVLELRLGRAEPAPVAPAPAPVSSADAHVVAEGETWASIAFDRLGDARLAEDLARLNGLDVAAPLRTGQVLSLR